MNVASTTDQDPTETREWLDALDNIAEEVGPERAAYVLQRLADAGVREHQLGLPIRTTYRNTLLSTEEPEYPGDEALEARISAIIRWNALMLVLNASKHDPELGGHLATYASACTLYEVGFNHCFYGESGDRLGDLLFIQGHASPGIYARAFLEGRLTLEQMQHFRRELQGVPGLASYPHPRSMPDFWQFPTVSMGLGSMQAIYQAQFLKYLHNRSLAENANRKVWAFLGDGEMDEPESQGALLTASREGLDNLIFVVNCNLQRLDGPVRGNSQIVTEMESLFAGAGWRVIKVLWNRAWDALLESDASEQLFDALAEVTDGEFQNHHAKGPAYLREHFFNKHPGLGKLVDDLSDEALMQLQRGGHDSRKVYAAYKEAMQTTGQPTVILVKTVKGFGLGLPYGEGLNFTHQQKKIDAAGLKAFRDRFALPITDEQVESLSFYHPGNDSEEIQYLQKQRQKMGGYLPARTAPSLPLAIPELSIFDGLLKGTGDRHISTTMAFVRTLNVLLKDRELAPHLVPILADEGRTFGMEALFRQLGIYSHVGQKYRPVDADQLLFYHEATNGQILQQGINEAGAFCSWMAAGSSHAVSHYPAIPLYIFYSMFGFQRIHDLAWAAGDLRARGFLLGAISGRTTLPGEGLQHQDGQSHLFASTLPDCMAYDPTFAYELAVIMREGLRRMYHNQEDIFYYITLMNEDYAHPEMPVGVEQGIIKGMYRFRNPSADKKCVVQLLGSGAILLEVILAADILESDFGITAAIFSVPSFIELDRDGTRVDRWNAMHPTDTPRVSYVTECLSDIQAPVVAVSDYVRLHAESIRRFVPHRYAALGTDGYGRSDGRKALRAYFGVDYRYIVVAALRVLADEGKLPLQTVADAIQKYDLSSDHDPMVL